MYMSKRRTLAAHHPDKVVREETIHGLQPVPSQKGSMHLTLKAINHMKLKLPDGLNKGAQTVFDQGKDENAKSTFQFSHKI